jgi:hypothetical protein
MNKLITHWKLIGALLLVFVSGTLCGSLGTLAILKKKIQQTRNTSYLSELWIKRLETKLDLTPDQVAYIKPIAESAMTDIQLERAKVWGDMQEILGSADSAIFQKLNAEQQKKYQELKTQRAQRIKKWLGEKE